MRKSRIIVGVVLWTMGLGVGAWGVSRELGDKAAIQHAGTEFKTLAVTSRTDVTLEAPRALRFVTGDPVFGENDNGEPEQIGEVVAVYDSDNELHRRLNTTRAKVVLYREVSGVADFKMTQYSSPDSLAGTLQTLLPPARRLEIAEEIRRAVDRNRDVIIAELKPIIERSLRESVKVVEQELVIALRNHRDELAKLGDRYQRDLVSREVVPLVRSEVLPIVEKHAEPLAEEIGQELWKRVSVWRFGWRYLADKTPGTKKGKVREEWRRFVRTEALPELESRSDEIVAVVQKILSESSKNKKVREAVRRNLGQIIEDPEVHRIVWTIFREVMIDSPRVREVLERNWRSEDTQRAFRMASELFEPTAVRIGELLLGTPESGITEEFAAVLRREILNKDQRWLVLSPRGPDDPPTSDSKAMLAVYGGGGKQFPLKSGRHSESAQ